MIAHAETTQLTISRAFDLDHIRGLVLRLWLEEGLSRPAGRLIAVAVHSTEERQTILSLLPVAKAIETVERIAKRLRFRNTDAVLARMKADPGHDALRVAVVVEQHLSTFEVTRGGSA